MKRLARVAIITVAALLLPSCGLLSGMAQTSGRTLQSFGRLFTSH
jgi:hypothetical protein